MASIKVAVWSSKDDGKTWTKEHEYDTIDNAISDYSFYAYRYNLEDADDIHRFRKDQNLKCSLLDAQFILKSKRSKIHKDMSMSLTFSSYFTLPGEYDWFIVTDATMGSPPSK